MKKPLKSSASDILHELAMQDGNSEEMLALVEKMQQEKPTVSMDADFRTNLLMSLGREFRKASRKKSIGEYFDVSWFFGFWTATAFALLGALTVTSFFGGLRSLGDNEIPALKYMPTTLATTEMERQSDTLYRINDLVSRVEYVYTGSLDGLFADLPVYLQKYPETVAQFDGYDIYAWDDSLMQYSGFRPDTVEAVPSERISPESFLEKMREHGNFQSEIVDGQSVVTVSLHSPKVIYQYQATFDENTGNVREYYVPSILFEVGDHPDSVFLPKSISIPYVSF